jgi:hypothetical protein
VCSIVVDQTAPDQLVRKLVGTVGAAPSAVPPPPSASLGVSSGYFPSPAVSEPTELSQNQKGSLSARMDDMSLDTTAC